MRTRLILTIIATLALAGCATGSTPTPASPSPVASPSPAAEASPSPAASASSAGPEPVLVRVQFDGTSCRYFGPEVFPEGAAVKFQLVPSPEGVDEVSLAVFGVTADMPSDFLDRVIIPASETPAWVLTDHLAIQLGPGEMYFFMTYKVPSEVAVAVGCFTDSGVPATPPTQRDAMYPAALLWVIPK